MAQHFRNSKGRKLTLPAGVGGSLLFDRNGSVAGGGSFFEPVEGEAGDARAVVGLCVEVNEAIGGGAGSAGDEGGVAAGAGEDEAFNGPGFSAVEAGPDGAVLPGGIGGVDVAEDEDVFSFDGESGEAAHATVGAMLVAVGEDVDDTEVFPGVSAIGGAGGAPPGVFWALLPVDAGVVVEGAVGKFDEAGFTGAVFGEGFGGLPSLAVVVGVDGVGVVIGPFRAVIFFAVVSGGSDKTAFVFSVAQGDAVLVHVHRGGVAFGVGLDFWGFLFPGEAVVGRAVD